MARGELERLAFLGALAALPACPADDDGDGDSSTTTPGTDGSAGSSETDGASTSGGTDSATTNGSTSSAATSDGTATSDSTTSGEDICERVADWSIGCYVDPDPRQTYVDTCNTYRQMFADDYSAECAAAYDELLVCLTTLECQGGELNFDPCQEAGEAQSELCDSVIDVPDTETEGGGGDTDSGGTTSSG